MDCRPGRGILSVKDDHPIQGSETPNARQLAICLVSATSAYANGGTAAYIRSLGIALQRRGHSVCNVARFFKMQPVVTQYERIDPTSETELDRETRTAATGIPVMLVAPNGVQFRAILARLASLISRPKLHSIGIALFNFYYRASLAKAVPDNTDVIAYTGNGWEMIGFTALELARRRGIPFTVTPFVHPDAWGDSPLDVRLYNQADVVFVCSKYEADHLIAKGVRKEVLRRTGLAPATVTVGDGERFRAAHKLVGRPIILYVGRKEPYKGYHALCESMEAVLRSVPDACLVAIGPDTRPPFPEVASGALLDLGALPIGSTVKDDALAACDVFCMPSEAEAFGIVYVEAWANRKPVVAGTAPAVRELIEEGVTGFCVAQEPSAIAEAVVRLLTNPGLCQRIGAAGYARQKSEYSWDFVASGHEQIFLQARISRGERSKLDTA